MTVVAWWLDHMAHTEPSWYQQLLLNTSGAMPFYSSSKPAQWYSSTPAPTPLDTTIYTSGSWCETTEGLYGTRATGFSVSFPQPRMLQVKESDDRIEVEIEAGESKFWITVPLARRRSVMPTAVEWGNLPYAKILPELQEMLGQDNVDAFWPDDDSVYFKRNNHNIQHYGTVSVNVDMIRFRVRFNGSEVEIGCGDFRKCGSRLGLARYLAERLDVKSSFKPVSSGNGRRLLLEVEKEAPSGDK